MGTCDLLNVIEAYNQAKSDVYANENRDKDYYNNTNERYAYRYGKDEAEFLKSSFERIERKLDRLLTYLNLET